MTAAVVRRAVRQLWAWHVGVLSAAYSPSRSHMCPWLLGPSQRTLFDAPQNVNGLFIDNSDGFSMIPPGTGESVLTTVNIDADYYFPSCDYSTWASLAGTALSAAGLGEYYEYTMRCGRNCSLVSLRTCTQALVHSRQACVCCCIRCLRQAVRAAERRGWRRLRLEWHCDHRV